jgi:hypothetical protein
VHAVFEVSRIAAEIDKLIGSEINHLVLLQLVRQGSAGVVCEGVGFHGEDGLRKGRDHVDDSNIQSMELVN